MRKIDYLFVHTTASARFDSKGRFLSVVDASAAAVDEYHRKGKGWNGIGYNGVFRLDGSFEKGRDERLIPAHVEGFNSHSLGFAFSGHGDYRDFTPEQKAAGHKFFAQKLDEYKLVDLFLKNPMRILGHREVNVLVDAGIAKKRTTKTCPGKLVDMSEFRRGVLRVLDSRRAA